MDLQAAGVAVGDNGWGSFDDMLWAITCYFNPAGWKRRLYNYRVFRERLNAPLVTVELSFGGRFSLGPGDADVLVQLDDGDVLFQKERLLNVALGSLPAECSEIAWIDADIVFGFDDWERRTREALQRYAMLHMFSERFDLLPESLPEEIPGWSRPADRISLGARFCRGEITTADLWPKNPRMRGTAWGLAWAARREVFDRHGFYDACVLASGDVALFCAAIGAVDAGLLREKMNEASYKHYVEWAVPFSETVQGSLGYIEGPIFHLWHGATEHRRYSTNVTELRDLDFDPASDIALTAQGCWRWNSDKPELHAHVRQYFRDRNEDGDLRLPAPLETTSNRE